MPHRLLHVMYRERAANAFAFKEHVASHSRARRLSGQSSSTLHTASGNQEENQRPLGKLWLPNTHRPPVQGHGLRSQSHRLAQGSPRSSSLRVFPSLLLSPSCPESSPSYSSLPNIFVFLYPLPPKPPEKANKLTHTDFYESDLTKILLFLGIFAKSKDF